MRAILLLLVLSFCVTTSARAQLDEVNSILVGGVDDATLILDRYLEPLGVGFGQALNTGWVGSARPHGVLGFHVGVGLGVARVPESDRAFSVNDSELQQLRVANPGIGSSPTFSGASSAATYRFETRQENPATGEPFTSFELPPGSGSSLILVPQFQASVGLIGGNSVALRFAPPVNLGDYGSVGIWGLGVQHGLNQWIPGGQFLPVNFSIHAGYTSLNMSTSFNDGAPDQELSWSSNGMVVDVLAGASFLMVGVYGGVGIETSSSRLALDGTYSIRTGPQTQEIVDPIDRSLGRTSGARALLGARLRLLLFTVNAEYTLARYPSLNVGVGLGIR